MKVTKKLRDVTPEEFNEWCKGCKAGKCLKCLFRYIICDMYKDTNWSYHKDLYSDKFLDQTIEVEVPDILDKEEKEYLSAVIKPFRNKIVSIKKLAFYEKKRKYIRIEYIDNSDKSSLCFPDLPNDEMYKGMEDNRPYKLEELGL